MIIEIKIHKGYEEFERAKKKGHKIPQLFGKFHYICYSDKGKISLIFLAKYHDYWEIYCQEGNLFEDTERFKTRKEAIKRVKVLLNG